jgi:predicted GIY-YIG superfamily endonuclease
MYYFYYFLNNGMYYGGITNSIARRTTTHNNELNAGKKSEHKPWDQIQGKIVLTVLWAFETRFQAATYEKQWIFANYKNENCLNCSVSNSEYDYTTGKHKELSEAGGAPKARPFYIKEYPSGKTLLEADSTCDEKAQELLGMERSHISHQLAKKDYSLFIKLEPSSLSSEQIVYLEYTSQSLSERAELLGRSIEADYDKIMGFHLGRRTLNLQHKDGRKVFLKNYTTYSEAGRLFGLKTKSELCSFCKMASGKTLSSFGWSLLV